MHTKSNSYALTQVTDQIIKMSLSGVCLECRLRIQPLDPGLKVPNCMTLQHIISMLRLEKM